MATSNPTEIVASGMAAAILELRLPASVLCVGLATTNSRTRATIRFRSRAKVWNRKSDLELILEIPKLITKFFLKKLPEEYPGKT